MHYHDASRLTLQFELNKSDLSDAEVQELSSAIGKACKSCSSFRIHRVDWRGLRRRRDIREQIRGAVNKIALTNEVMRRLSRSSPDAGVNIEHLVTRRSFCRIMSRCSRFFFHHRLLCRHSTHRKGRQLCPARHNLALVAWLLGQSIQNRTGMYVKLLRVHTG